MKWRATAFVVIELEAVDSEESAIKAAVKALESDILIKDFVVETVEPIWVREGEEK